ncbi:MAG: polysaccharide deacetylase family protein [Bacteroidetes bacterium]|jgi:peptidoglycan/xylan/chitin deacetylase (PgdA/CDA1 family)|nr:polysaccharide deacetylase family protein [Bacteroidota bacterium]
MNKRFELPVLLYHRIVEKGMPVGRHKIYVWKHNFEKQMRYLHDSGIQTITFEDILKNKQLDLTNKVILTFDDGYTDNYHLMYPVLKKYGFKAVIYLVTGTNHNAWGVKENEPRLELMNTDQLQELCNYGIEIGGHTRHHPDLSRCNREQLEQEINGCKNDIEMLLNKPAISFAYPFGGINEQVKAVTAQAGFQFAVATNTGPTQFGQDMFQIRRIEIMPRTSLSVFKKKVSGFYLQPNFVQSLLRRK